MRLLLSKYKWFSKADIHVTGFIRRGDEYIKGATLADYFSGVTSQKEFVEKLLSANGRFAVVIQHNGEAWIAVDRLRSIPLFYNSASQITISDSAYQIVKEFESPVLDGDASIAFMSMGYTLNRQTLISDVYQVEAGEMVVLGSDVNRFFYHNYSVSTLRNDDYLTLSDELGNIIQNTFRSHLTALKDRFIAIPLSGGYDSRLIALMCHKYHPENVLCFTYGREGNTEAVLAKEVAEKLSLPWINIVYSTKSSEGFLNDGFFTDYCKYASELTSMFFMDEYFAVRYLKANHIIPDDSVFVPGFSGDFIAGGHLLPGIKSKTDADKIVKEIFSRNADMIKPSNIEKKALSSQIKMKVNTHFKEPWLVFENWDIKERQAKFIVNSASVFNYFGFDYILPFWDNAFIDFFNAFQFEYKLNKSLYDHTLTTAFFKPARLNFKNEINPTDFQRQLQQIKVRIKRILPEFLLDIFIDKKSPVLYDEISDILIADVGRHSFRRPHLANNYNSYLTQWYLINVRQELVKNTDVKR